mgnify:CR=1 FL=1
MVIKVAVPHQFKLKVIPDLKTLFFVDRKDIHYIGGSDILPAPLEAAAEKKAIKDLGTEKDENARKILIEHNLRLVVYIAKKFDNTGVGVEDLISIGTIGLIKAISTFRPEKGSRLATYAAKCIDNELLMMFRARKKTMREISLYEPIGTDKEGNEINLLEVCVQEQVDVVERLDTSDKLRGLAGLINEKLNARERQIIMLRYGLINGHEKTQREIGAMLGISRSYVSRIEKRALEKLREGLEEKGVR